MATINISNCTEEQLRDALAVMLQALNSENPQTIDPQFTALAQQLIDQNTDIGATINLVRNQLCEAGQEEAADAALEAAGAVVEETPAVPAETPALITATREQWREIQTSLRDCGLYDGAIDGLPTRRNGTESQTQAGLRQLAERAGVPLESIYNPETNQVADPARIAELTAACISVDNTCRTAEEVVVETPPAAEVPAEEPVTEVPATTPQSCAVTDPISIPEQTLKRETRRTNDPEAVRELQTHLQAAGIYTGAIDGDYGPATRLAVIEAQGRLSQAGYDVGPVDGKWGERSATAYNAMLADGKQLCDLPEYTGPVPTYTPPVVVTPTPPVTGGELPPTVGTDCSNTVATSMPDIPPLFNPGFFGSLNTQAGWRRVDRGADEGYEFQYCGILPEGIRAATADQVDDETSKVNVPDARERRGTPPRAVGERSFGNETQRVIVREDGLIRVEIIRERDGGDGHESPNPGPNGGPNEGDPCGGCGGPNASLDIQNLFNNGTIPTLPLEQRLQITGGVAVAEAAAPAVAGTGEEPQRAVG